MPVSKISKEFELNIKIQNSHRKHQQGGIALEVLLFPKGDTNLRKSVGWRTFKVLAFWSEGKWQAQFLKLVPPF